MGNETINITWWGENGNWGDLLSLSLVSLITGKGFSDITKIPLWEKDEAYRLYCIGSILEHTYSSNYDVWGSGLNTNTTGLQSAPRKIYAVRGPLTRKVILKQGYECPEVYGDPALLMPKFYTPKVKKKYKWGIIPHFSHQKNPWLKRFKDNPDVKIINVLDPTITRFIDEVNECEIILSSSLHGIICGDSYGIPSYWIDLRPDYSFGEVNWFKFNDYFLSVGRPLVPPINIHENEGSLENLWPPPYNYHIKIDLDKLINAFPLNKK